MRVFRSTTYSLSLLAENFNGPGLQLDLAKSYKGFCEGNVCMLLRQVVLLLELGLAHARADGWKSCLGSFNRCHVIGIVFVIPAN